VSLIGAKAVIQRFTHRQNCERSE